VSGRETVMLVARREFVERGRAKAFRIGTLVTLVIVALVAVLPTVLGVGGDEEYTVAVADPAALDVARAAQEDARAFDATITVRQLAAPAASRALEAGDVDAVLTTGGVRAKEKPDDALVDTLQAANRRVRVTRALRAAGVSGDELRTVLAPPPLRVATVEPVDEQQDERGGFAFFTVILLYGQLITFGFLVASGVVEEKASRVVEVLLSTISARHLLTGKILGLGLLGLVQLLLIAVIGLGAAGATGALEVDRDVLVAAGLALAWFVLGYAFYSCAFACAGALVPRQEELQSTTSPLTLLILVSFFLSFAVLDAPDGTLARVSSFLPFAAPMTMPTRIALGEASAVEIVAAIAVTAAATVALIPLAGRIYSGAVLRTGAAVKFREAWRAARA